MKFLLLLIPICSLAFSNLPVLAKAKELPTIWLEITQSQRGDRFLVDINSLRPNTRDKNRKISFQVQVQYKIPTKDGTTKTIANYTADCINQELTVVQTVKYNRANQIIDTEEKNVSLPVEPDSMWEDLYNYSCRQMPAETAIGQ